jgi:hypothetical protein
MNNGGKTMYIIIKKSDFGTAGISYAVAEHDEERDNAISKKMALDTLNNDKETYSFQLWSSEYGYLDLEETDRKKATDNDKVESNGTTRV